MAPTPRMAQASTDAPIPTRLGCRFGLCVWERRIAWFASDIRRPAGSPFPRVLANCANPAARPSRRGSSWESSPEVYVYLRDPGEASNAFEAAPLAGEVFGSEVNNAYTEFECAEWRKCPQPHARMGRRPIREPELGPARNG